MTTTVPGFPLPRIDAASSDPAALRSHTREIAQSARAAMGGKINAVVPSFSLVSGVASTVLTDVRLAATSFVAFDPLTANAATELAAGSLYALLANRNKGAWTFTHAVALTGDRTFRVLIIG